jgi:predicted transcriptional regulator
MSTVKEEAIAVIQSLPDDCSYEDIQYHLYVRAQVERGIRDVEAGRVVSREEARKRIHEWLSSSGPKQP